MCQFVATHWPSIITAFRDLCLALAAIFGLYISYQGLKTWRQKHVGQSNDEVARQLLRSTYGLQRAVWDFRCMKEDDQEEELPSLINLITVSRRNIKDAEKDFLNALSEARILWGRDAELAARPLLESVGRLNSHIDIYKSHLGTSTRFADDIYYTLFHMEAIQPDVFDASMQAALKTMEDFAKQYLIG